MVGPQLDDNDAKYTMDGLVRTNYAAFPTNRSKWIHFHREFWIAYFGSIVTDQ